jgi:hypothetical protein
MSKLIIHFVGKEKETISYQDDDRLEDKLKDSIKDKGLKPSDFNFYYRGSLINYSNNIKIKDTIFGGEDSKEEYNIFAVCLLSPPKKKKKATKKEEKEYDQVTEVKNEIKDDTEKKDEIKSEKTEETSSIRRKKNRLYYNDIICPKCETTAIIDKYKNNNNISLFKVLNCENFHFLDEIKYDKFDYFVVDYDKDEKDNYWKKYKCDTCNTILKNITPGGPHNGELFLCKCGAYVCNNCYEYHKNSYVVKEEDFDKLREGTLNEEETKKILDMIKESEKNCEHKLINFEDKNYYCLEHMEKFTFYCMDCNANKCDKCKQAHEPLKHETIDLSTIKPKREYIQNKEKEVNDHKESLLKFIENTRILFDNIINTIENYLNSYIMVENGLIRRYKNCFSNYQLFRNLKNKKLFENDMFDKLQKLESENDTSEKIKTLINDIYEPIIKASKIKEEPKKPQTTINTNNEFEIVYTIPLDPITKKPIRKIKLFDPAFVQNNKGILSMETTEILKDGKNGKPEKRELDTYYKNSKDNLKILKVILKEGEGKKITDMSYMFNNIKNFEVKNYEKWNIINIVSMERMYQLSDIKDIKFLQKFGLKNPQNLENMSGMFCKCKELKGDINMKEYWPKNSETNIKNLSMLFNGCINLTKITFPNWRTPKLLDISYLFSRCKNLTEAHSLDRIRSSTVKNMCGVFNQCKKLTKITAEGFDCTNVEDMSIMFQGCENLNSNDYITNGNETKNLKDIRGMFSGCKNWINIYHRITSTDNIVYMGKLFNGCEKLNEITELGKNSKPRNIMKNVINAKEMFAGCTKSLKKPSWINNMKFPKKLVSDFNSILDKSPFDDKKSITRAWEANAIGENQNEIKV